MKLSKLALVAAIACGIHAGSAFGQQAGSGVQQVACADCDCGQPVCGCEAPSTDGCDNAGCDAGCGSACDSGCGIGSCLDTFACGELCDPWKLFPCAPLGFTVGGWTDIGYHTANNSGLGILGAGGAPSNFNNYANKVQLQQQWFNAERIADGSEGLGIGGRIDYLYGTDGPDTQAFGIANDHWDNSWDNGGAYGHAIPQLYGELAYGKTSVKLGHFFTIVGNEVVQATGNFFYSRQFTFYNAEPFTHTGALATHQLDDSTTVYGGYVMGWDSGFEDNGDAYIGGIKRQLSDDFSLMYSSVVGRFNDDAASTNALERGSVHNVIATTTLSDKLTNIMQFDYLDTEDETGATVRETYGVNAYFIYQLSDRIALGSRTEYFNWTTGGGVPTPRNADDLFNQTVGVNYRVSSNILVRPEIRSVWDAQRAGVNENFRYNQPSFGMDAIFTF